MLARRSIFVALPAIALSGVYTSFSPKLATLAKDGIDVSSSKSYGSVVPVRILSPGIICSFNSASLVCSASAGTAGSAISSTCSRLTALTPIAIIKHIVRNAAKNFFITYTSLKYNKSILL